MKRINNILLELYKDKDQLLVLSVLCYMSYWLEALLPNDPNVNQASGAVIAIGAAVTIGVSMYNGAKNRKAAAKAAEKAAKEKAKQVALLNKEKARYEKFEFVNPYAQAKNQFEDLENTMEDLTVNQQQAQFEAQEGAQQRSNIMETMRGATGGSGIAALAQTMANQGQLATQRASASIGQQETANQRAAAQQAGQNQSLERQGAQTAEGLRMKGEEMVARQEADRRATLLGIQASIAGGASQAATSADQMSLETDIQARNTTTSAVTSGVTSVGGAATQLNTPAKDPNATGCFMKGVKITMFDGSIKSIEDIKLNDEIKNINGDKEIVINPIVHDIDDVISIYTNGIIKTTDKHPLFINNKWTNAEELGWNNKSVFVDKLYNLEIKGDTNTFIADNIVVSGLIEHVKKEVELKQI